MVTTVAGGADTATKARQAVLAAPAADLAEVGRHVIAGYRDPADIKRLIAIGAVGGVFVTARNAQDKTAAKLAAEIAEFQKIARDNGREPLVIATDQEGGLVTRLSPPLKRPPRLSKALKDRHGEGEREAAAWSNGEAAGRELAAIGVTLNFAPVVDLDFGVRHNAGTRSRITERAISKDPEVVASAARAYCDGLAVHAVQCTLKHFPGLGRIAQDTHVKSASLEISADTLETTDWHPFRTVLPSTKAAVMVGHVTLTAIDAERPASISKAVIDGVLRQSWQFDGLVITDDLSMKPTAGRVGGIGVSAASALAAGADYLLVSIDGERVYEALHTLLQARASGELGAETLAASRRRIVRMVAGK